MSVLWAIFLVSACLLDSEWHWNLIFLVFCLSGVAIFSTLIIGNTSPTLINKGENNYEGERDTNISEIRRRTH